MEYMTPKEAAEKWGITPRRVQFFCSEDRVPGAVRMGRQWLIPISAPRPDDGRTKEIKNSADFEVYHFPALVYTDSYSARTDLSDDELELLNAQLLFLKGEYTKSLVMCRSLSTEAHAPSVRFGAYCTNVFNGLLLGLFSEVTESMKEMEKIRLQNPAHDEDYKLLITACKVQQSYKAPELDGIDTDHLSPSALIVYELLTLQLSLLGVSSESKTNLNFYNAFSSYVKAAGITPAYIATRACLSVICNHSGDLTGKQKHIEAVCKTACKEGLYTFLSKYSNFCTADFDKELNLYGADILHKVKSMRTVNARNWRVVFNKMNGTSIMLDHTSDELETMLLVANGMSNKTIATLKNTTVSKVSAKIKVLCTKYSLQSKAEFEEYLLKVLNV